MFYHHFPPYGIQCSSQVALSLFQMHPSGAHISVAIRVQQQRGQLGNMWLLSTHAKRPFVPSVWRQVVLWIETALLVIPTWLLYINISCLFMLSSLTRLLYSYPKFSYSVISSNWIFYKSHSQCWNMSLCFIWTIVLPHTVLQKLAQPESGNDADWPTAKFVSWAWK